MSGSEQRGLPPRINAGDKPVNSRHRLPFLAAILPAAGAIAASAASAQPIEVPTVTIYANQAPTELAKSGASVTVVTGEQLRAQGSPTASPISPTSSSTMSSASRWFADRSPASTVPMPRPA
jgi:outer membrane receptor protein involved in Fe transport